jgi:hypothetical protein
LDAFGIVKLSSPFNMMNAPHIAMLVHRQSHPESKSLTKR